MFYSAFVLGLAGSLHCFGMCGPISLLLPVNKSKRFEFILAKLVYNFGRIVTYSFLGWIIGLLGEELSFVLPQKILFLSLAVLISFYLFFSGNTFFKKINNQSQRLNSFVKRSISHLHKKHGFVVQFVFGLVNGLIPCGLVYAALSAAFLTSKISDGALYMMFFGLGTLPMMLSFGWLGSVFNSYFKLKPTLIYKAAYALLAIFLFYKGFTLPISHYANSHEMTTCIGNK